MFTSKQQQQYFNQIWPRILKCVTNLSHSHPISRIKWRNLMKLIYNLNHWDRNGIEKMRESLKSEILTIIKGIKQKIENETVHLAKLKMYVADWNPFISTYNDIPIIFNKLSCCNINKYGDAGEHANDIICIIQKMLLDSWIEVFFKDLKTTFLTVAMERLNRKRNPTKLDSELLTCLKDSYIQLFPESNLKMYKIHFEQAYFEKASLFYKQKADEKFRQCYIPRFVDYVFSIMNEEEVHANKYLHSSSVKKFMNCVAHALTSNYLSIILATCPAMIQINDIQSLNKLFLIMIHVPNGLPVMLKHMEEFVVKAGLADLLATSNIRNPINYVNTIVELLKKYYVYLYEVYDDQTEAYITLDNAFERIVNDVSVFQLEHSGGQVSNCHPESNSSELLASAYNILLRKTTVRIKLTTDEIETKLNKIFNVLKYIKNPEIFIKFYLVHLSHRLIFDSSADIIKDQSLVKRFNDICLPEEFIYKLVKMFQDIKYSDDLNQEFRRKYTYVEGINSDALSVKILNSWAWPAQLVENNMKLSLPAQLEAYKSEMERFYSIKYHNRKLQWSNRMSRGTITFTTDVGQYDIKVTAYQMIVLFVWNQRPKDKISLEGLKLETGLPDCDIRSVLWSLIAWRNLQLQILLASSKVSSPQSINDNTLFWINERFSMFTSYGVVKSTGVINLTTKIQVDNKYYNKEHNYLAQVRATRVLKAIKKILKMRKRLLYVELEKELDDFKYESIKQIIKEQVEYLIECMFIKRDSYNKNMLVYINTSEDYRL